MSDQAKLRRPQRPAPAVGHAGPGMIGSDSVAQARTAVAELLAALDEPPLPGVY